MQLNQILYKSNKLKMGEYAPICRVYELLCSSHAGPCAHLFSFIFLESSFSLSSFILTPTPIEVYNTNVIFLKHKCNTLKTLMQCVKPLKIIINKYSAMCYISARGYISVLKINIVQCLTLVQSVTLVL